MPPQNKVVFVARSQRPGLPASRCPCPMRILGRQRYRKAAAETNVDRNRENKTGTSGSASRVRVAAERRGAAPGTPEGCPAWARASPAGASGGPRDQSQTAQPMRSLSRPASIAASEATVFPRSEVGRSQSFSKAWWAATVMQSE